MAVCAWLLLASLGAAPLLAQKTETLRGKLLIEDGSAFVESGGKRVRLAGDAPTEKVIHDTRLSGFDIEAKGRFTTPAQFTIEPSHTRPILVRRDGHIKLITYWCDVCSIRTYAPGVCWCCQQETVLDLRDPDQP